jgi:hypothetical protein
MKRSALAIVCGVLSIGIPVLAGDQLLPRVFPGAFDANGFTTNSIALAVMLVYTVVFSAFGGWVTALISRRVDALDIWVLASLQFVMTLVSNAMLWDSRLAWFYAIGALLTLVSIVLGGRMRGLAAPAATRASS